LSGETNQSIVVNNASSGVEINQNTFSSAVRVVSKCVEKSVSSSAAITSLQKAVDQTTSTTVAGVSIWGFAAIAGIIVIGIVLTAAAPVLIPMVAAGKNPQIIGFVLVFVAVCFLAIYFAWTKKVILSTPWALPLSSTCVGNLDTIATKNASSATEAATLADKTKKCVAYDFIASRLDGNEWVNLSQPHVILYSSSAINKCKIQQDTAPILTNRIVRFDKTQRWSSDKGFAPNQVYGSVSIGGVAKSLNPPSGSSLIFKIWADPDLTNIVLEAVHSGTKKQVVGPGRTPNTTVTPNVSGIQTIVKKQWALYVGIGLGLVGLIIIALLNPKHAKEPKQKQSTQLQEKTDFIKQKN
jgi:hypothetical protein